MNYTTVQNPISFHNQIETWLSHGKWNSQKVNEWCTSSLFLHCNQQKELLPQFKSINFPNLQKISLDYNNIQTIQMICRINMPVIETIFISNNRVNSIKILKKAYFLHLDEFSMFGNKILNGKQVSYLTIKILRLEAISDNYEFLALPQLTKIKSNLNELYIHSSKRISQPKTVSALQKKNHNLRVYKWK